MKKEQIDLHLKQFENILYELMKRLQAELSHSLVNGITPSQFLVLKKLSEGKVTVSELSEHLGVSLSAITSLVDRLKKSGYVERTRDEQDRRLVWLAATPLGLKQLERCVSKRSEVIYEICKQLPDEDLQSLNIIYTKILDALNRKQERRGVQ